MGNKSSSSASSFKDESSRKSGHDRQSEYNNENESKSARDNDPESFTKLEIKMMEALKEIRAMKEAEGKVVNEPFNRIMLRFPLIAKAFNSARRTFDAFDTNKKGFISLTDLTEAMNRLGADFDQEEIDELFSESDMKHTGKLNFKEFLVCLSIGFVLHRIPSLEDTGTSGSIFDAKATSPTSPSSPKSPKSRGSVLFGQGNNLRTAFDLAVDAFLWFDVDGGGTLDKTEMGERLVSAMCHSPTKKMNKHTLEYQAKADTKPSKNPMNALITDRRFNEMDWNKDGSITFQEFLLAFESWAGVDDDEEEDDE